MTNKNIYILIIVCFFLNAKAELNAQSVGLFSIVSGQSACIRNLGIESGNITGNNKTGAISGKLKNGASVKYCYNKANVYGINGTAGIVGENSGNIMNCYNMGNVFGSTYVGGITGKSIAGDYTIKNCYTSGYITGYQEKNYGAISGSIEVMPSNHFLIENNYYNQEVNHSLKGIGNANSRWGIDILEIGYKTIEIKGKQKNEMVTKDFILALNSHAYKTDSLCINNAYPILYWEKNIKNEMSIKNRMLPESISIKQNLIHILNDIALNIYTISGKAIYSKKTQKGTLIKLQKGVYILMISNKSTYSHKKLIIF